MFNNQVRKPKPRDGLRQNFKKRANGLFIMSIASTDYFDAQYTAEELNSPDVIALRDRRRLKQGLPPATY